MWHCVMVTQNLMINITALAVVFAIGALKLQILDAMEQQHLKNRNFVDLRQDDYCNTYGFNVPGYN